MSRFRQSLLCGETEVRRDRRARGQRRRATSVGGPSGDGVRLSEGKQDMEAAVKRTEALRAPLAEAIRTAMIPVKHRIRIQPKE